MDIFCGGATEPLPAGIALEKMVRERLYSRFWNNVVWFSIVLL